MSSASALLQHGDKKKSAAGRVEQPDEVDESEPADRRHGQQRGRREDIDGVKEERDRLQAEEKNHRPSTLKILAAIQPELDRRRGVYEPRDPNA